MKALALDLGASGGKILSGSYDGRKLKVREIHRFNNEPVERDSHLLWDFQLIHSNLLDGLRKAASEKIDSFGVDSFSNDYGLLDETGKLISPVYMYRDLRTEGVLDWVDQRIPPMDLFTRTGCQRARFNTLVQLAAQTRSSDHDLLKKADRFLFVPDLLNYFLCGEKAAEYTIASVSQAYNRRQGGWDPVILQALEIPAGIFPDVVPPATTLGEASPQVCAQTGMEPFFIRTVGHHDTASAVAAVPDTGGNFAYISSGTWSLMGVETAEMITTERAFQCNFANEGGLGGSNRFLKNIMGLWLLQEVRRQVDDSGKAPGYEEMNAEAEKAPPFRSIINPDDPRFFERGDMVGRIQSMCREWNQPVPETVGELTRCILESLALAYRATLQELKEITGSSVASIHIIGGGARNTLLNRFAASALGRPVSAGPLEAAAVGNLCAQFLAAGEMENLAEARGAVRASFDIREFLPENTSPWDDAFERFMSIKNADI